MLPTSALYFSAYFPSSVRYFLIQFETFKDTDGDLFLHAHHIIWLNRNGPDTIDNCVALCPNCHAKMHILDLRDDIAKLTGIAKIHS
jgi:5-methylcytosine-specific restriction protein A